MDHLCGHASAEWTNRCVTTCLPIGAGAWNLQWILDEYPGSELNIWRRGPELMHGILFEKSQDATAYILKYGIGNEQYSSY